MKILHKFSVKRKQPLLNMHCGFKFELKVGFLKPFLVMYSQNRVIRLLKEYFHEPKYVFNFFAFLCLNPSQIDLERPVHSLKVLVKDVWKTGFRSSLSQELKVCQPF